MAQDRSLQAQAETVRVAAYGPDEYDPSGVALEQIFMNCFPEVIKDSTTGDGYVRLIKREGIQATTLNPATSSGATSETHLFARANIVITQLNDVFVMAFANNDLNLFHVIEYRPSTGTSTLIGNIGGYNERDYIHIEECQIVSGGTVQPGITVTTTKQDHSSSKCYWAVSNGTNFTPGVLQQILTAAFPDQQVPPQVVTGPMIQMNGIFYVYTTKGVIWCSGSTTGTENDPTVWNTLSNILTYQYPDGGIGIYRYKHHIVAFGTDSIEFFNDVGNPPPANRLERTDQAFIKFGALSSKLVLNIDDTLYWISYSSSKTLGLWKLEGYTPVKISTGRQDTLLIKEFNTNLAFPLPYYWLFTIVFQGKKHVGIANIPQSNALQNMIIEQAGWGNLDDTFYGTLQSPGGPSYALNLMYNVEDKTWWGLRVSHQNSFSLLPATNYPGISSNRYYQQFMFLCEQVIGTGIGAITTFVHTLGLNQEGFFYDTNIKVSPDTKHPIPVIIQTNTMNFGNVHKKKISRFQPVFTTIPGRLAGIYPADTNQYSMSLFVNRQNLSSGVEAIEKIISYPNDANRYYWNNLGTARQWQFTWCSCNRDSLSISGYDITVHQGIH